tara:strand:- start:6 stop:1100 length:1095 start_codon:yes stop_codon:yes gene_type:complete
MKVVVIGAGPVGCYAGYLLAKTGHEVTIYDRKPVIGSPIQCTGILTSEFDHFGIDLENSLVNTIDRIDVISSSKKVSISQKDYIVCRKKFDQLLAKKAEKAGAKLVLGHVFVGKGSVEGSIIVRKVKTGEEFELTPDLIIGADGPLSKVAKEYGFFHDSRKNFHGIQATVEGNFEKNAYQAYFGNEVCPGLFAWVVPESSTTARVGLATKKNSKYYFDKFMQENNFEVKEMQAGTIPVFSPKQRLVEDNCYLVGDACGYVKATTLGGIIPGMKQVKILVDCLNNGKDYVKEIKPLRRQMKMHLLAHKVMQKLSDKDWARLVGYAAKPRVQRVLEKYTRDNPVPLMTNVLLREPRLLLLAKFLLV